MRYKVLHNTITNLSVDFNQSKTNKKRNGLKEMEKLYRDKIHCLTSKSRSDEGDIGFSSERGIHESGSKFFLSSICQ